MARAAERNSIASLGLLNSRRVSDERERDESDRWVDDGLGRGGSYSALAEKRTARNRPPSNAGGPRCRFHLHAAAMLPIATATRGELGFGIR